MTRAAFPCFLLAILPVLSRISPALSQESKPPEFVQVKVGIADRYKVGVWTPIEVTLRGGSPGAPVATGRVRATVADSDGMNCVFEAPGTCEAPPGRETRVPLYVRFGHQASTLALELLDPAAPGHAIALKTMDSSSNAAPGQYPDSLRPGQRLIVSVGKNAAALEQALPGSQGQAPQNVVAAVDSLARLPTRWEGLEGVDFLVISTSSSEVYTGLGRQDDRIEALDQWIRLGGTLVLFAGSNAESALHADSPLARFVPGRFEKMEFIQASAWETFAGSSNRMSKAGENLKLATPRLVDAQGKIEAREGDVPLVIRKARGFGQVIFVAADLDLAPLSAWSDRWLLVAALLNLPANFQAHENETVVGNFGYNDLAGQLHSALDQPRDVRLVPFFAVALLAIIYILWIGPGDYFLLRRLGRGMHWTWLTFPLIVIFFSVAAIAAAYWCKGDQLRVNQVDLVDVDAEGVARGASWFSIFSPRGESFDLSMRPRLPNGEAPQQASVCLGWLGKAGEEFNGMYSRDTQGSAPLWGRGYSIAAPLDSIHEVPIQVWGSKSFVQRWLGHAPSLGLNATLQDDEGKLSGTVANRLTPGNPRTASDPPDDRGLKLSHCFLAYESWAYVIGTLAPGEVVEIGPTTRRIRLNTFLSGETMDLSENAGGTSERNPYDRSSRDAAYVLQRMIFFDAAGGRKQTGMSNDYQGFTDLSGLLKTGRAILVGMPPQDGSGRGGDLLRGPMSNPGAEDARQPLGNAFDRHTTIYRFVLPVAAAKPGSTD